ncbi:MAG: hypothetical protein WC777_04075 [Candidatus Gracilibacteria bacterium]|jgi:hypothetical protein
MELITSASDLSSTLDRLHPADYPARLRMSRPGFEHFAAQLPVIDPTLPVEMVQAELQQVRAVLGGVSGQLKDQWEQLNIPQMRDGVFGRVILGMEEPTELPGGNLHGGTLIVLGLWGNGFAWVPHGHEAGFMHEELIRGAAEVRMFDVVDPVRRTVKESRRVVFDRPGIMASAYCPEGSAPDLGFNLHAVKGVAPGTTVTLHYLPGHVRDTRGSAFTEVPLDQMPEFRT